MELTGRQIDKYLIKSRIGQGGMADVYLALDTRLDREVAFKMIRTEMFPPVELERILKRFEIEAKALAKLNHPNIIQVIDYGDYDGKPYLVMPYLPGGTLKDALKGAMDWREAFQLLLPIVEAVSYAHKREILHRDIKPSNILLHTNSAPLITDFGVAKILSDPEASLSLTLAGIGTPNYMSPEQWEGKAEYASDQYSLGVVLYQMVTDELPYAAETPMAVMTKVIRDPLPPAHSIVPALPQAVEDLISKMMMKDPAQRYADLDQVSAAMRGLLSKADQPAPKPVVAPEDKPRKEVPTPKVPEGPVKDDGTRTMDGTDPRVRVQANGGQRATKSGSNKNVWIGVGVAAVLLIGYFGIKAMYQSTLNDISDALSATNTPEEQAAVVEVTETIAPTKTPAATATAVPSPTAALTFDDVKDEGYFALETDQGELILLSKDGKTREKVDIEDSISKPAISPDGLEIALITNKESQSNVINYDFENNQLSNIPIVVNPRFNVAWWNEFDSIDKNKHLLYSPMPEEPILTLTRIYGIGDEKTSVDIDLFDQGTLCSVLLSDNSIICHDNKPIFNDFKYETGKAIYYGTYLKKNIVTVEGFVIVNLISHYSIRDVCPTNIDMAKWASIKSVVCDPSSNEIQMSVSVSDSLSKFGATYRIPNKKFTLLDSIPASNSFLINDEDSNTIEQIRDNRSELVITESSFAKYTNDANEITFIRDGELITYSIINGEERTFFNDARVKIVSFDFWEPVQQP